MTSRLRRLAAPLVVTASLTLLLAPPAMGIPSGAWVGTWEESSGDPFEVTGSDSSLQILTPCPNTGNPTGIKSTGRVTSADNSVSEWEYSGEPDCPGAGGTYTATMSKDCLTVKERGVTKNGTPFEDTWTRVSAVPAGCGRECESAGARTAAINEVRVVRCVAECEYRTSETGNWRAIAKDTILKQGDEISCDPDGSLTLAFADNSTVVVRNTTQLKIKSFFTEGGVVRTELLLKMGEISAKVNKSETTRSDFVIRPPGAGGSVRGTEFTVFYDPIGKASLWSVKEGTVEVDPVKAGLPTKTIGAGKEVEVTAKRISAIAGIGKAGARGGLTRSEAVTKVLKIVAKANVPCGITTPRTGAFGTKPARGGWLVSVKVSGRSKGTAKWKATAKKTAAANKLAKKIAGSCR